MVKQGGTFFFFAQIERKHTFAQIQIFNISQNIKKSDVLWESLLTEFL